MSSLIVVNDRKDWPLNIPDVTVVSARVYLTDSAYGGQFKAHVFNLCKSYRYQSIGYYVSLLAEARGHKPLPQINVIEDLQSPGLLRLLAEKLDEMVQKSLAKIESESFELSIYFGRNVDKHFGQLSRQFFDLMQAPLLRVFFDRHRDQWHVRKIQTIAASDIPSQHQDFVIQAATKYLSGRKPRIHKSALSRYDLAILHDPDSLAQPSNAKALKNFEKAAKALGMYVEFITRADLGKLYEFDALFIRDTTNVNHYTYRFSRRAVAKGLVVIDDPNSILKCSNKVYLAELLTRHRVPTPRTLLVHQNNIEQIIPALALPCILKKPDGSFSLGVDKVSSEEALRQKVNELLNKSELIVAQTYLPTEFDWRIGILNRRPLFACKYFMVPGHWQIIKHGDQKSDYIEGLTQAIPLDDVPTKVVKTALQAANLIGDGFYGVDIKQIDNRCYVIEINDNPNVDAGNEDAILKDALYHQIMEVFLLRIKEYKQKGRR